MVSELQQDSHFPSPALQMDFPNLNESQANTIFHFH